MKYNEMKWNGMITSSTSHNITTAPQPDLTWN